MNIVSLFFPVILAVSVCSPAAGQDTSLLKLIVKQSGGKEISYHVEVADTDVSRRLGLMFRKHMPVDQGMLLDFGRGSRVGIWMKNTYIPLDLLFIDTSGKITHTHAGAVPLSTKTISGGDNVRAVLEINAGQIDEHGINVGDRVIFPGLGTK